jgi:hypothetical protein
VLACGAGLDCEEFVKSEDTGFAAFPAWSRRVSIAMDGAARVQGGNVIGVERGLRCLAYLSAPRGRLVGRDGTRNPRCRLRMSCRSLYVRTSSP